jgi:hypothetical protein
MGNKILLHKLEFYELVGKFNLLIKSYLCERFKRVLIIIQLFTIRSHIATGKRLNVDFH